MPSIVSNASGEARHAYNDSVGVDSLNDDAANYVDLSSSSRTDTDSSRTPWRSPRPGRSGADYKVLSDGHPGRGNSIPDRKPVKSAAMRTSLLFGRADVARASRRVRIRAELHGQ